MRRIFGPHAAILAALFAAACGKPAAPAPEPSVLVTLTPSRQGAAPDVLTAYGSAGPAVDAVRTLSVQLPGQVLAVHVVPAAPVRAGQRLIDFSLSPASVGASQQAAAALTLAQQQLAHANQLFAQQLATADQVAQGQAAVKTAQANLAALEAQARGGRGLDAPFDGFVVAIPVAPGEQVAAGAPLLTLARQGGLVVTAGFEPSVAGRLRAGEPASLQNLAGGPDLQGRVVRVTTALDPKTRLVNADVVVPGAPLVSGAAFRVSVTVGTVQGWLAPHRAVLNDAQGDYVFQVSGNRAIRAPVRVLETSGDTDVLQGALDPHRPLVVDGAFQLQPGAPVRVAAPAQAKTPAQAGAS